MGEGQVKQQPIHILTLGDSLTEGYYEQGRAYHPYSTHLTQLFQSAKIPVKIDNRGSSGERVVPRMVNRLRTLLTKDASYDWIIVLGGTNDIFDKEPAEKIFKEGLQPIYEMCLNQPGAKIKLAVMTVIEISYDPPTDPDDKNRQSLNAMIRDYVAHSKYQDRICLIDLDKGIPYHSIINPEERNQIWDDGVHLTPAGYNRMARFIFDAIKSKL